METKTLLGVIFFILLAFSILLLGISFLIFFINLMRGKIKYVKFYGFTLGFIIFTGLLYFLIKALL